MNSAVITKIEYKRTGEAGFTQLDIIPFSGKFSETQEDTNAGIIFSAAANFKMAKIEPDTDSLLNTLTGRQASFKITDANGTVHTVGDTIYRARFYFDKRADGNPGSFNGYECRITCTSPTACPAE